jgi:hypothetical protein
LISDEVIDRLIAQSTWTPGKRGAVADRRMGVPAWDELVRRGLVDPASRQAFFGPKLADFKPIRVKGKPVSEIIIEERGER